MPTTRWNTHSDGVGIHRTTGTPDMVSTRFLSVAFAPLATCRQSGKPALICAMNMDELYLGSCKQAFKFFRQIAAIDHVRVDHQVLRIESTHRQEPPRKHLRDVADLNLCLDGFLSDVNCMSGCTGSVSIKPGTTAAAHGPIHDRHLARLPWMVGRDAPMAGRCWCDRKDGPGQLANSQAS